MLAPNEAAAPPGLAAQDSNSARSKMKVALLLVFSFGVGFFSDVLRRYSEPQHLLTQGTEKTQKESILGTEKIELELQPPQHCLIHVSGFHHSGTGVLRMQVLEALGEDATIHNNTYATEDEGQHLQNVYPSHKMRLPDIGPCNLTEGSPGIGQSYFCPPLLEIPRTNASAKLELFSQWSKHWNMSKTYLIQKTPTFDVLFLEQMKVTPTVHAIVMRYPFQWKQNKKVRGWASKSWHEETVYLFTWVETWAYILEQLHDGNVDAFVVVNYEAMVADSSAVQKQMSSTIKRGCAGGNQHGLESLANPNPNFSRKLHLHGGGNSSSYLSLSEDAVNRQNRCLKTRQCHRLMKALTSVLSEFGYTWDTNSFFNPPPEMKGVLFSSDNPPSKRIVDALKEIVQTHGHARPQPNNP